MLKIVDPIVVDTETYYDAECSVKSNPKRGWVGGNYAYVTHPKFYCYMITHLDINTGVKCCETDRAKFPALIESFRERTIVGVNCGFDAAVCWRVMRDAGVEWQPFNTLDMGDMSQYLQAPRSLAGMAEHLLGVSVDKTMRSFMSGRHYAELNAMEQAAMKVYGMGDVDYPAQVYRKYLHLWPDLERWLSDHTRRQNWAGVRVDLDFMGVQMDKVQTIRARAAAQIPWLQDADSDSKPLSPKALAKWCRAEGVEPPASLAEDDPECQNWERINGEKFPVVAAMRDYRKSNTYIKKLQMLNDLLRPDGTVTFGTKYAAAPHTLRWGAEGWNYHSLPRPDLPGGGYTYADLRGCLIPRDGHRFIAADLSNIEARCLPWLAGDTDLLRVIASGVDIYEAFGRRAFGYSDPRPMKKVDKQLRDICKTCVLQLGYQSGATKFCWYLENNLPAAALDRVRGQVTAMVEGQAPVTRPETNLELAQRLVSLYRSVNFRIKDLWGSLNTELNTACQLGREFSLELPNRGIYRYFNLAQRVVEGRDWPEIIGQKCRGVPPGNIYGGKVCENITQRVARDVVAEAVYGVNQAGIQDRMIIHDEIVCEVPEAEAEARAAEVEAIMSRTPAWLPGCPIAAETNILTRYAK